MKLTIDPSERGRRLDAVLHSRMPEYSRSRLQDWIRKENVLVDGVPQRVSYLLRGSEQIDVTPAALPALHATAEEIELRILYEDDDLVAIDKPAGMVVHAGAGVSSGTLVNALLHHFESLSSVGGDLRPGIVHRLDRFTSGVLLVAKTDAAHRNLAHQFASRQVRKVYLTTVHGRVARERGTVEKPITRDPKRRERMTARLQEGRTAYTEYRVLQRYADYTYLEVLIGTGRTHQIRVHLASIGHPVAGDRLYGAPPSSLDRYFLHAHYIEFRQPSRGELLRVESPLPAELEAWRSQLAIS